VGIRAYASGGGRRQPGGPSWTAGGGQARGRPGEPAPIDFRIGDDVRHVSFGEGVVTGTDPAGGTIAVRFASGSEKRLIADHTAVSRIGAG
jgi:hypothetical protein